jgi:hypothetical protein
MGFNKILSKKGALMTTLAKSCIRDGGNHNIVRYGLGCSLFNNCFLCSISKDCEYDPSGHGNTKYLKHIPLDKDREQTIRRNVLYGIA